MELCSICSIRMGSISCRRCGRKICIHCHTGHGLCTECRKILVRW